VGAIATIGWIVVYVRAAAATQLSARAGGAAFPLAAELASGTSGPAHTTVLRIVLEVDAEVTARRRATHANGAALPQAANFALTAWLAAIATIVRVITGVNALTIAKHGIQTPICASALGAHLIWGAGVVTLTAIAGVSL